MSRTGDKAEDIRVAHLQQVITKVESLEERRVTTASPLARLITDCVADGNAIRNLRDELAGFNKENEEIKAEKDALRSENTQMNEKDAIIAAQRLEITGMETERNHLNGNYGKPKREATLLPSIILLDVLRLDNRRDISTREQDLRVLNKSDWPARDQVQQQSLFIFN